MTTTVTHELKPGPPESPEWPILEREPAHARHGEPEADSFDPTQGQDNGWIGAEPYDDPTQGQRIGAGPHDDPTQGQGIGAAPHDDPTQGQKIGSDPYDDPTQGRGIGTEPYDDPTQGQKIGSDPYEDPTRARRGALRG